MAKLTTQFTLALCSPTGLDTDREAVRQAVFEVNRFLSVEGKQVQVKGWDTDVRPTVGTDAQDVVNREMIDTADIGLVIIGDTVGSPTPRSPSGTVEEARSFIRRRKAGAAIDLMLYFKLLPIRYDRTALDRLAAIVAFREEMQSEGVFWREYETDAQLAESVRTFLPAAIRGLQTETSSRLNDEVPLAALTVSERKEIEEGVLDQEIAFADAMAILSDAAVAIGGHATRATDRMSPIVEEIRASGSKPRDAKKLRRVVNDLGSVLDAYADALSAETEKFEGSVDAAVNATIAMVGFVGSGELPTDAAELAGLEISISEARAGMLSMAKGTRESAEVVQALPNMTKELNAAKRRVTSESQRLETTVTRFSDRLAEVGQAVQERLVALNASKLLPGLGG
ncbi:hypothetical protein [uncultured Brevundimonas sp.]|uniref:hypothetical protein n=1 Tax=uncultured Brevundimonas sp. TaxID=213418 RepID=UPI0030ECDA78|tara:strand:+ start:24798 stop:25991 length:1194 start_codon:yes stop_codon:yes gene_type:complete